MVTLLTLRPPGPGAALSVVRVKTQEVRQRLSRQVRSGRPLVLERLNELRAGATVGAALGASMLAAACSRAHPQDRLGAGNEPLVRRLMRWR